MWLLQLDDNGEFSLVEHTDNNNIPRYAVLSHTWGKNSDEVTFQDLMNGRGKDRLGYRKIRFCMERSIKDGLQYSWIDTCCIDKTNSTELQEAINSMFRWYQKAERCYVYLSDVSRDPSDRDELGSSRWKPAFRNSRWFTRGWTLQELIAPKSVDFFSKEGQRLGDKQSLEQTLHEITGIAIKALRGGALFRFSIKERMSWVGKRQTKREEDEAYSLLGIFDISMPLIYGEGREKAFNRLEREIREPINMLLDSLRYDQIDARQMTIKNAHAKTCKWLLKDPKYVDWLNTTKLGEHHGFLWIKGKPGTGKSTLMKFALTNAYKTMEDMIAISFFFNARGRDLEKSTTGTYRSLLLQIFKELPELECVFGSLGLSTLRTTTNYQWRWSAESLKTLLQEAIQSLGKSSIVCFIDALDECEECQIRDMISFFESIGELAVSAGIRFQICFSSRHYPHITIRKGLSLILEGEGHDQDIANYLESELKIGYSKVAEQVRIELQERASGIFMWVVLVVGILNKEYDSGRMYALWRRLQEIPSDLYELFHDILTRDSDNQEELVLCIKWVAFARQLLRPEQLYFAILSGVEPKALSRWDPSEITRVIIERFILSSSKGLAEITKSGNPTVQFIHESVKDFLLKENALGSIWPGLRSNFEGQSHERLKHCCIQYINSTLQGDVDHRELAPDAFPFLEYAARNVLYHAEAAARNGIIQEIFLQNFPLLNWVRLDNLFQGDTRYKYTQDTSLLYILAEGNMSNLIRVHPSIFSCFEVEKERYSTPFLAALATGSKDTVQAFVEAHLVKRSPGSRLHKLWRQYCQGEGSQREFRSHFISLRQRTTLSFLAELGDEVLFHLVLEMDEADINSKDGDERTPLSWAAAEGYDAIVKLLLDTGKVDVDSKDGNERTPLSWAAAEGCDAIVKLLLDTGKVDVNSKDGNERTPLLWAVAEGYEVIFKLLLDTGKVDVDSKDRSGRTPLSWAVAEGYEAIVKLLLNTGKVDVNSKDQRGRTPLWWATLNGNKAIFELLLDTGKVDVNSKDQNGWAPLSWAAVKGYEVIFKLLLGIGKANIN